jgi:hypothetical protein
MISKFNVQKQKSIVYCIVNTLANMTSGWAKEIAINITDFTIHRISIKSHDIFIGDNEEELLRAASDENYTHAVVMAMGTSFKLSDRIFAAVEKKCSEDFYIAGHIIDRDQNYYELHHQFYIVRLSEYKELKYPSIGSAENVSHIQIEPNRSIEGVYGDHDLPIHVSAGTKEKSYNSKMHGWNILSNALLNNKKIVDLGEDIRNDKKYFYYEYDHVFLREMREIYYQQFFCNTVFFPWNTDSKLALDKTMGPVEQYITVGTGLNWVRNLNITGYKDDATIIFTDINQNCLQFMRELVTEWDGNDYIDFYKNRMKADPNNNPYDVQKYADKWTDQYNEFIDSFEDWASAWNKIKKCRFQFIHIDYTATYNLDWIDPSKKTIMNLSDLYNHVPYVATQSLKYRIACENHLLIRLKELIPDAILILTARATDGFEKQGRTIRLGRVSEFQVNDINLLKRPIWHETDWQSPRPLI